MTYMDDPEAVEAYIETLTPKEAQAFNMGYAAALHGVLEALVDTKRKLLHTMMINGSHKAKEDCKARVAILDAVEAHFRQRVEFLENSSA